MPSKKPKFKKISCLTDYNNINRTLKHEQELSFCINVKNEKKNIPAYLE